MDKPILNIEQIKELKHYIYKRGFRDPIVINEILDHFACKVEELLQNENVDLDTAMEKAHKSFGKLGFKPLVDDFYKSIEIKYRSLYRNGCKNTLTHIPSILFIVSIGVLVYYGFIWTVAKGWYFWGTHTYLGTLLFILYAIVQLYISLKAVPKVQRQNVFVQQASKYGNSFIYWFVMIFSPNSNEHWAESILKVRISGFVMAILTCVAIVQLINRYKTINLALNEAHEYGSLSTSRT